MTSPAPRPPSALSGEPTVSERTWTEWQVRRENEDAIAFSSEDRAEAERWLSRLRHPVPYVLARVERRSRCESWWSEAVVVPTHSRCSWVAGVREDGSTTPANCERHGWHGEDEPVPDEFWIGKPPTASAASRMEPTDD